MNDLLPDQIELIVSAQRRKNAVADERAVARREAMRIEARRLADAFVSDQSDIRRIVLFGSLTQRSTGRECTDIDLYVEGVSNLAALERIAVRSKWPVDIVTEDLVSRAVVLQVERYGEVLYEADG